MPFEHIQIPAIPFYLLGMGHRRKLIYRAGVLADGLTGNTIRRWILGREEIDWHNYTVLIETDDGRSAAIIEDEEGIWIAEGGTRRDVKELTTEDTEIAENEIANLAAAARHAPSAPVSGNLPSAPSVSSVVNSSLVNLPTFEGHPHQFLLTSLHQEVLVNILPRGPMPNFLACRRPWYRDAAMVAMVLDRTGNMHLLRDWILGLKEVFDGNSGNDEPDNLGQVLYLISLVSDAGHPLVAKVLEQIPRFRRGNCIAGITDGAEHAVYQTKWLKFGLNRLGLRDEFEIPKLFDNYSALFWWDYTDQHVPGPPFNRREGELYPYLAWAEAHFNKTPPPLDLLNRRYPLTWEASASEADYAGMNRIAPEFFKNHICLPHSWHAAEAFLLLIAE